MRREGLLGTKQKWSYLRGPTPEFIYYRWFEQTPEAEKSLKSLLGQVPSWRHKDTEKSLMGPCWALCFSVAFSHDVLLSHISQDDPSPSTGMPKFTCVFGYLFPNKYKCFSVIVFFLQEPPLMFKEMLLLWPSVTTPPVYSLRNTVSCILLLLLYPSPV